MTHTEDVETTGNFEVFVNGRLAHSKTSGDGYVDTPAKINALKRAVRDATAVEAVAKPGRADGLSVEVPTAAVVMQGVPMVWLTRTASPWMKTLMMTTKRKRAMRRSSYPCSRLCSASRRSSAPDAGLP